MCYLSSISMGVSPKNPSMLGEEAILQGRAMLDCCSMHDRLAAGEGMHV